jgi:cell division protein FtsW (lipid II flippase)
VASVGLAISTWGANEFSMAVLFLIACACAGLGVAALWSTVLPRAVRRVPTTQLRRWQLVGLRLGALVAVVMLALLLFNEPRWRWGTLAWVLVFAWPLVAARCLTGEVGQWLFIPRDAR